MPVSTVDQVAAAVERELGLTVHQIRRQIRWRPTWFVHGERDGQRHDIVVRGDRVDTSVYPLTHELAFHSILADHGIPVPKIYGYSQELHAIYMELVPGKPDFDGVRETDRDQVVDEYLQAMVRVHQLPLEPFVKAGIFRADDPRQSGTAHRFRLAELWRSKKTRPDPFTEFCLGWLRRHPPQSHGREAPVLCDTGQFHHQNGQLVAILDLELAHIGDPMIDLAVWRMRDTLIPYGDFTKLYARYEELSGTPIDLEAIKRHTFASTLGNQLMFGAAVLDPVAESDLMTNMQWTSETNLFATEFLAEYMGIELPEVETPEPRRTRHDNTYAHLVRALRNVRTDDDLLAHEIRLTFRMARHLQRVHEIGDAIVEADLDDVAQLLGWRPATWEEGDAELERFVLADADHGRYDEELVKLFHRRNLRTHMQLGPEGSRMVAHHRMQPFSTA